ncbi:MAG: hypothetical protein GX135_06925 [Candidatus Cloacimonetes bacterium]|nr:hypothetical protein [Candidatus Cloacimonadota bacterium]
MISKIRSGRYQSLVISLGLHALLLIFMIFYVIRPMVAPRWHEIMLGDPLTEFEPVSDDIGPGAIQPVPQGIQTQAQPEKAKTSTTAKTSPAEKSNSKAIPQTTGQSDLIDLPQPKDGQTKAQASLPTNPLNPLKGIPFGKPNTSPGGRLNYSISGGSVKFTPNKNTHNLGEPGKAIITFRLDNNARLIPISIDAGENSGPRFFDEAKRILEQGRFEFTGTPNPGAEYTITITFSI